MKKQGGRGHYEEDSVSDIRRDGNGDCGDCAAIESDAEPTTQPIDSVEPIQSTELVEPIEPIESIESTELIELVEPI